MNRKVNKPQNQETALEAYIRNMAKAEEALDRINQYIEDRGEVSPDEVNWSHVGWMASIASELSQLQDQIDGTGEFAL